MTHKLLYRTAFWIPLLLLVALAGPVAADTHTVTGTGAGSIQAAINSAHNGDTIVLPPGTYSQHGMLIAGKSLTFRAADGHGHADTIIDGMVPAASFTVTDDNEITAVSPKGAAGTVDVTVATPGGVSAVVEADRFTYIDIIPVLPVVNGIVPATGPATGGTIVTISGTGFTGATAVTFGTEPALAFAVTDDNRVVAASPPAAPGTADITVTTPGGTSAVVDAGRFTYTDSQPVPEFPAIVFPVMALLAISSVALLVRKAGLEHR